MTDIKNVASLESLGLAQAAQRTPVKSLGQEHFLQLLSATIENQDPTAPQDNTAMITQIAQFSLVESNQNVENELKTLSGSMQSGLALQASSLVGKQVLVEGNQSLLTPGSTISGVVDLPENTSNLMVDIKDSSGVIVRQMSLGSVAAGQTNFTWDGKLPDGTLAPPGVYSISAHGTVGSQAQGFKTSVLANVDSVTIGNASLGVNGFTLNVSGIGAVGIDQVREYK